jgi:hypothetical protein
MLTDVFASSVPDTVSISTFNSKPIANAGPDQSAIVGATIADGRNPSDSMATC